MVGRGGVGGVNTAHLLDGRFQKLKGERLSRPFPLFSCGARLHELDSVSER